MTSKQAKYKAQSIKLSSMLEKTLQEIQIYNRRQVQHQKIAEQLYSNNSFLKGQIQRLSLKLSETQKSQMYKCNPQKWRNFQATSEAHKKDKIESISRLKQFHLKISELLSQVGQILHSAKDVSQSTIIKISKQYHKYYNAYMKEQSQMINQVVEGQMLFLQNEKIIKQNGCLYDMTKKLQTNSKQCEKLNKKYSQQLQKYEAQNQKLKQLIIQVKTFQKKENMQKRIGFSDGQFSIKNFQASKLQDSRIDQNQVITKLKQKINQLQVQNATIKNIHQQTIRKIQLQSFQHETPSHSQHHSLTKSRKRLNSHSHSSHHSQNSPRNQWANKNQKLYEQIRLLNKKLLMSQQSQQKLVKQLNRLSQSYKLCQQQKGNTQNQTYQISEQMNLVMKNLENKSDIIQQQKQTIARKVQQIQNLKQSLLLRQNQKQNIISNYASQINQINCKLHQKSFAILQLQKSLSREQNKYKDAQRYCDNKGDQIQQLQQKISQLLNELSNSQRKTLQLQNQIFQQSIKINQLSNTKDDFTKNSEQSKNKLLKNIQKMQIQKKQIDSFVQLLKEQNQKVKLQNQRSNKLLQKSDTTMALVKTKLNQLTNTWGIDNIPSLLQGIRSKLKQQQQMISNLKNSFKQQQNKFEQQEKLYMRQIQKTKQKIQQNEQQKMFDNKDNKIQLQLWRLKLCPQHKVTTLLDILQYLSQKNQSILLQQKQKQHSKPNKLKSPSKPKAYEIGYSSQQYKQLQLQLQEKVMEVIDRQDAYKSLQIQNSKTKDKLIKQTVKVQQFQQEIQRLKRQISKKDNEMNQLNMQINNKIEKTATKVKNQQRNLAQLQILQKCDDFKIIYQQKIRYFQAQIDQLQQKLKNQQKQKQKLYNDIQDLNQQVIVAEQKGLNESSSLKIKISKHTLELQEIKNIVNVCTNQNINLKRQNLQKQKVILKLQTNIWESSFVQQQNEKFKLEIQQLTRQIQQIKVTYEQSFNNQLKKKDQIKQSLIFTQEKLQLQEQNYKQLSEQTDKIKIQLRKIRNIDKERQKSRSKEREQQKKSRIKQRQSLKSVLINLQGQKSTLQQNLKASQKYKIQLKQKDETIQSIKKQLYQIIIKNIQLNQIAQKLKSEKIDKQIKDAQSNQIYQSIKKQYAQIKKRELNNVKQIKRLKEQNLTYLQQIQNLKINLSQTKKVSQNSQKQRSNHLQCQQQQVRSPLIKKSSSGSQKKTERDQQKMIIQKQLLVKLKQDLRKSNELLSHYQEQNQLINQKYTLTLQKQHQIQERYNQIQAINKTVSQKLMEMKNMYEQSRNDVQYLQVQNKKLSSELSSLKTIYEEDGDEAAHQRNQKISELEEQIQCLNLQINKLKQYEALGFEVSQLKQILQLNDVQIDQIINLEQKLNVTMKQNRQNQLMKTLKAQESTSVQQQNKQKKQLLQKDVIQLKRQLIKFSEQNLQLKKFIAQNQQAQQSNIAQNIQIKAKINQLTQEIQLQKGQVRQMKNVIQKLQTQNLNSKQQIDKYRRLQESYQANNIQQLKVLSLQQKLKRSQQKLKQSQSYLARFRQNQNIQHPIQITIHPVSTPKNGQQFQKQLLLQNQYLKLQVQRVSHFNNQLQQKLKQLQKSKSLVQLQVDSQLVSQSSKTPNTPKSNSNQQKEKQDLLLKSQKHHSEKNGQRYIQKLFLTAENNKQVHFQKEKQEQNKKSSSNSDKQQNRLQLKNTNISSLLIQSNTNKKTEQLPLQILKKQTQQDFEPQPSPIHPKTSVVDTLSHKLKNAQKIITLFKVQNQQLNHQLQLQKLKSVVLQKQVKAKVEQIVKMKRIVEEISDQIQFQKKRNKNFQQLYQKYKTTKKVSEDKPISKKKPQEIQKKQQNTQIKSNQKKQKKQKIQDLPLQFEKNKCASVKYVNQKSPRIRKVSNQKKLNNKQNPLK